MKLLDKKRIKSADLLKIISVAISDHKKKKKVTLEDLEKVENNV